MKQSILAATIIALAMLGICKPLSATVTNGYVDQGAAPPTLTLKGFDFGPLQGSGTVLLVIDGVITPLADINNWTDNTIVAELTDHLPLVPGSYLTAVIPDVGFIQAFYLTIAGTQGPPIGSIMMWSGSIATIPTGWLLCDGTNGTPDLRDRFIAGASADDAGVAKTTLEGTPAQLGGSIVHDHSGATQDHSLTIDEIPSHLHHFPRNASSGPADIGFLLQSFSTTALFGTTEVGSSASHAHDVSDDSHVPVYFALAFIMKQ